MNSLISTALFWVLEIVKYAIFARIIISWIPISKDGQFIRLLYQITEPVLAPIRSMIERSAIGRNMMLDFSPILAFLLIELIQRFLI